MPTTSFAVLLISTLLAAALTVGLAGFAVDRLGQDTPVALGGLGLLAIAARLLIGLRRR